jgi:flagellar basal-body rod protein FlgF
MDVLFTAYPALNLQMNVIDNIANNLANANTTGFKRQFERILEEETGPRLETQVDLSPGDVAATGNPLDVAIDGAGFFAIQTPAGIRYTRAGGFEVNIDGDLVTRDGMKVLSSSGSPVNVTGNTVTIQDSGAVTVDGAEVATLRIVTFPNTAQLETEGANRFVWRGGEETVTAAPEPRVRSGYLERSNVNAIQEMTRLIRAYREFEAMQRAVTTINGNMTGQLISDLGQLG